MKNPCEDCIIKMLCTILCEKKIDQVVDKVVERKKLVNPNFSKRGGVTLSDFIVELKNEGIITARYEPGRIEVLNGTIEGTKTSP